MVGAGGRQLLGSLAALLALGCAAAACSEVSSAAPAQRESVVALGDSVPRGTHCNCRPYPPLTADDLRAASAKTVTATNDTVAGYTTADVVRQLRSNTKVVGDVRRADVVEIEIGANDVGYTAACGANVDCYAPRVPTVRRNLAAIVARVDALTAGHKKLVVLLDYWSVWLGGQYAAAKGQAYVAAAEEMTDRVNSAIKSTAAKSGSAYVDLRAAFKGPDYSFDETHYLSSDGDHPNAAGHRRIASAAGVVIKQALGL